MSEEMGDESVGEMTTDDLIAKIAEAVGEILRTELSGFKKAFEGPTEGEEKVDEEIEEEEAESREEPKEEAKEEVDEEVEDEVKKQDEEEPIPEEEDEESDEKLDLSKSENGVMDLINKSWQDIHFMARGGK